MKKVSYEEIIARDKTFLDRTWPKDKSLADPVRLPDRMHWPEHSDIQVIYTFTAKSYS